jgi:sodium transport system permease protein
MRAMLTVLRKEIRENLRDRRTLLSSLIFGPLFGPLLFAGALLLTIDRITSEENAPVTLAVSHSERAPNLIAYLRQHGVTVQPVAYEDESTRASIRYRRHKVVLMIPENYARQLEAGEPAPLLLYADASDTSGVKDAQRVRAVLGQYNQTLVHLRMSARGVNPLILSTLSIQSVDVSTPASRSLMMLSALTYLVLITMLMGGFYLAIDATAGERERGSLESLLTIPVPREQLIYGKIIASCAFMLLALVLTCAAFSVLLRFVGLERFGMSVEFGPVTALKMVAFCAPLSLLGASLMTIVAAFTRSYREAQTYVGVALFVPTLPLIFAGVAGWQPTTALMAVPALSQHFLMTSLLRAEGISALDLLISVGATVVLGAILAWVAGRLYHREALLG